MMNQLKKWVIAGVVWSMAQALQAAPVSGLYQVREPVQGSGEVARTQAFTRAFDTLVQRLTGSPEYGRQGALAAYRATPEGLASNFDYHSNQLEVSFDPARVMQAMRSAQVPVWGTDRPVLLVWWMQEGLHGTNLLGEGNNRALNIQQTALHRGVPVRFPLADLNEQVRVDAGWEEAGRDAVQELLQRYSADALLVVHSGEEEGAATGRWRLLGGYDFSGNLQGSHPVAMADDLFVSLAGMLAREQAVVPGQGAAIRVILQGLDLDSMLEAEQALQVFDGQMLSLQGDEMVWDVTAVPEQLRNQLGMYRFRELEQYADEAATGSTTKPVKMLFTR